MLEQAICYGTFLQLPPTSPHDIHACTPFRRSVLEKSEFFLKILYFLYEPARCPGFKHIEGAVRSRRGLKILFSNLPGTKNACCEIVPVWLAGVENPCLDKASVLQTRPCFLEVASARRLPFPAGCFQHPASHFTASVFSTRNVLTLPLHSLLPAYCQPTRTITPSGWLG